MSKVKIQGNASGTGVVTLSAPDTSTDRTIILPDADVTLGGGVFSYPEGTAILSTGETGGTKFLREDGDGTCSWQVAGGGGGGAMEFISKATISSAVSSVLITLPTSYTTWKLVFNVTLSGSSKVGFKVKDNGSIYSSSTYHWRLTKNGSDVNFNYQQRINVSSGSLKTKHFGEILINNETEFKTFSLCNSINTASSSDIDVQTGCGRFYNHTLTSLEAIEFSPEANNMTSGSLLLYGIKDS